MNGYVESCMDFSPLFAGGNSFHIEKSDFRIKQCKNVKTVEFITLRKKNKLYFIEAKLTAPNPNNPENKDNIFKYYQDLTGKIQQSIDMFVSKEIGVNFDYSKEFPLCFNESNFSSFKLVFLLIIRNHEKEWCSDVQAILQQKLLATTKIWNMEIIVLTGEEAISNRFVSSLV
ncbi:MAG: hypothetical protein FWF79_08425 [Defluviitaleaceae bacterium]|nr:hypothetical protein [Defluviitaleaceae bacterium]